MTCARLCVSLAVFYQVFRGGLLIKESVNPMRTMTDSNPYLSTLLHRRNKRCDRAVFCQNANIVYQIYVAIKNLRPCRNMTHWFFTAEKVTSINILKWKMYELIIYLKAETVQTIAATCLYIHESYILYNT